MKKKFFDLAKEESYLSDYDGQHLGAIAVYRNKVVLAKGHNSNKTHTSQFKFNIYRVKNKSNIMEKPARYHAEISIYNKIRFLDTDFSKITVYIYRETKDHKKAMARCCPACEAALRSLGIRHIAYTTEGGFAEEVLD